MKFLLPLLLLLGFLAPPAAASTSDLFTLPVEPVHQTAPATYLGVSTTGYIYKTNTPLTSLVLAQLQSNGYSVVEKKARGFCSTARENSEQVTQDSVFSGSVPQRSVCVSATENPALPDSWYTVVWVTSF